MIHTGCDRRQLRATRKQICGFAFHNVEQLLFCDFGPPQVGQLQQLAFDHFLGDIDKRIQDIEVLLAQRERKRPHVEPIAGQDRHRVPPV